MTSLRRLGCASLLLAAGLVPTVASSAQAGSAVVVDGQGDVRAVTFGPRRVKVAPAPENTTSDITRVEVDYKKRFLIANVQLRAVKGKGKNTDVRLRLKGGGGDGEFIRGSGGRLTQFGMRGIENCRGGSYTVDAATATVRFRVPARCFDAPDRVRFGVSTLGSARTDDDSFTRLTDDARTSGGGSSDGFAPTRLGAPVRRG